MKKSLIILTLAVFGTGFANNLHEEKPENKEKICTVSCWVDVTNTETGNVYHFTASATSSDCATATGSCLGIVYNKAKKALGIK